MEIVQPIPFKGFWIRAVANFLDIIIIVIFSAVTSLLLLLAVGKILGDIGVVTTALVLLVLFIVGMLLYKPLMEASDYQGTFGKHILSMKIVDKSGRKITLSKSFVRSIIHILHFVIPVINSFSWLAFLVIGFTEQKQGLHDIVAETYVVTKHWDAPIPLEDNFGA